MRINEKFALVTGGGSGIGEAVCLRFAEEGATVIVADISEENANRVAESIGAKAVPVHQDVTSEQRWAEVITEIIDRF